MNNVTYEKVFCCCGFFAQAFYITFTANGLLPHACYEHPSRDGRGLLSVEGYESVFCDANDSQWISMVSMSAVAIVSWPIGLFCLAIYLIVVAPRRSTTFALARSSHQIFIAPSCHDPTFVSDHRSRIVTAQQHVHQYHVSCCSDAVSPCNKCVCAAVCGDHVRVASMLYIIPIVSKCSAVCVCTLHLRDPLSHSNRYIGPRLSGTDAVFVRTVQAGVLLLGHSTGIEECFDSNSDHSGSRGARVRDGRWT